MTSIKPSSSAVPASVRPLGTRGIVVSAVALVMSASTLVSDFTGYARLGLGFALAVGAGLAVMIPVVISTCDLAVGSPQEGGIYRYVRSVVAGRRGKVFAYFVALLFTGTFLFGAAGETVAGAHALCGLLGDSIPLEGGIIAIGLAGILPNLWGLRWATRVTAVLLAIMLGLRWFFGLAGFFDWGGAGVWRVTNLMPASGWETVPWKEALPAGLALGFWCFVGVEGACALVGETGRPERTLPRGLLLALGVLVLTTLVTGLGALGGRPLAQWQELFRGEAGGGGEVPHLAVGEALFGDTGRTLMAVATLAATASTLLIAFAAMPRMLCALARDRLMPDGIARMLRRTHGRSGAPREATLLLGVVYLAVAVAWGEVVDCLMAAAYLWFVRHALIHALAWLRRARHTSTAGAFGRRVAMLNAAAGLAMTGTAFAVSFVGMHVHYGTRALWVAGGTLVVTGLSHALRRIAARRRQRGDAAQPKAATFAPFGPAVRGETP